MHYIRPIIYLVPVFNIVFSIFSIGMQDGQQKLYYLDLLDAFLCWSIAWHRHWLDFHFGLYKFQ